MNGTDPSTNGDGAHQAEKKPKRKKKKAEVPEPIQARMNGRPQEEISNGRLGSDIPREEVDFFLKPYFPRSVLSFIVGRSLVGKSTFVAWLVSKAVRACVLPGYEEVVGMATIARMVKAGVNLKRVRFLDDRHYSLPKDKDRIARMVSSWEAELVVIDPIDSYMDDTMSENDGKDVRTYLEAWQWVAQETRAAVIGVRHPGKDKNNLMPGSRQWRNVPRSIVYLSSDGAAVPKYLLTHDKDSHGQDEPPHHYELAGKKGEPRVFKLEGVAEVGLSHYALDSKDPSGRRKVRDACLMLMSMFDREDKPRAKDYKSRCKEEGISDGARYDAMEVLKVDSGPEEAGGEWFLFRCEKEWPKWLLEEEKSRPGGVPR